MIGDNMNIIELITKKKNKETLTREELKYIIDAYLADDIKDYQMSSLLMAICINGMEDTEIYDMTELMLNSGDRIDLSEIKGIKVDKHSTGGVGDKTTLILAPLVASCGVCVPKMSGRSLGHTGGTIDKLEAIKGFKTELKREDFIKEVNDIQVAIVSQTGNLVPADKKIYSLRDVSGTVESIPLIATSIMSKKLACGADKIVLDVKVGNGALMKNLEDASILADTMIKIGKKNNVEVVCMLTDMSQPLGNTIGNSLEVLESIEVLKGNGPKDLIALVIEIGSIMVSLGKLISYKEAEIEVKANLKNGKAYNKFCEMIKYQEGDINNIEVSKRIFSIKSTKTGFVNAINAYGLGEVVRKIGGGRYSKKDIINHGVGVLLSKKVGDYVLQDEELLKVYLGDKDITVGEILECFEITQKLDEEVPLIHKIIK